MYFFGISGHDVNLHLRHSGITGDNDKMVTSKSTSRTERVIFIKILEMFYEHAICKFAWNLTLPPLNMGSNVVVQSDEHSSSPDWIQHQPLQL